MTHVWRPILFYSFVAFFLIASVALVLYGTGYRYNHSKRTLEKTGELIMETQPKGASVLMDGKDIGKKTPLHLKYILPGTYRLTITKEGYLPFTREISISSGLVAIVNDVVLIKDLGVALLFSHPDTIKGISAITQESIFFTTDKSFFIYDRNSGQVKELVHTAAKINVISSNSSPSFYVYSKTQGFIVEKNTGVAKNVSAPLSTMHSIVWTESEKLFGITPKGIVTYDPFSLQSNYIAKGVFHDLAVDSGIISTIEERNDRFFLLQLDSVNREKKTNIYEVKKNTKRFVKDAYPFVILQTEQGEFFSVEQAKRASSAPIDEIQKLVFPSSDTRIAASEYEIWLFEKGIAEKNKRLLMRRADPIIDATLIEGAPYVLVGGRDILELLEISNHPTSNHYEIMSSERIGDSIYDSKEKKVFFTVENSEGSKVYERLLIE